jgi:hypothetical protein
MINVTQPLKMFDPSLAVLEDYLDSNIYPARLAVSEAQAHPLRDAFASGNLTPETHLLTFEHAGTLYAFPMALVLCYNVIQGEINQQPWMMTFCNACNTGMVFNPVLDGQTLNFRRRGSYDGLLLVWDEETNTYWQHITGQGLHGSNAGKQLEIITTTRHMKAGEAAEKYPQAFLLTSPLTEAQQTLSGMMEKMRAKPEKVEAGIVATIAEEDKRRPRFELGLGIWTTLTNSTFFPLVMLHMHDNTVITEFEGRTLLIYHQLGEIAPVAAFVDTRHAYWQEDTLRLDGGAYIHNDQYYTADGQAHPLERPMQLLMRWYGFALTFPGCRVPEL